MIVRLESLTYGEARAMADWLVDIGWALLWCAVLALLTASAIYLLGRFRGNADEEQPTASGLLTNFRELHERGGLSDEEYRTIKTLLSERLQEELKDTSDKG